MRQHAHVLVWGMILATAGLLAVQLSADDWPQWRGPTRDGVWRETGIVEKFDAPNLPIVWRQPIGPGYSGPTVADGRVFVTDRQTDPKQIERVHCFDAATGKPLWDYSYDCPYEKVGYTAGPRASVTIDEGRAYALGTMGHLHCFNAATGEVLWKKDLNAEYKIQMPMWGIAAAPLVVDDKLILNVGGEHACVVALDKKTGEHLWKSLDDPAQYSAPVLIHQAGQSVVAVWTGAGVVGLSPADGKELWRADLKPKQMPIGILTPVVDGDRLFVSSFFDGSLMLRLKQDSPAVEQIWRKVGPDEQHTESLHCMIGTTFLDGEYLYGVDSYGELRCLNAATGERIWESDKAVPKARWATIHMVRNGDRVFLFNDRGELIIAHLTPEGYEEISRAKLIDPTPEQLDRHGGVCWSHPAFANKCVYARNDKEIVSANLAAQK